MRYSCSLSIHTIIRYNCEVPFNLVAMDEKKSFLQFPAPRLSTTDTSDYIVILLYINPPIPGSIRGVGAGEIKGQLLCLQHFLGQKVDRKMLNF